LFACGNNANGELGLGTREDQDTMQRVGGTETFNGNAVRSVRCGDMHTLILTTANTLWSCGHGAHPLCGTQYQARNDILRPTPIKHARFKHIDVVAVAAGDAHSAAITARGRLYTWGAGMEQVGNLNSFHHIALGHANKRVQWLPRKIDPRQFQFARLGCWHYMHPRLMLPFVMATHKRLGKNAVYGCLPEELLRVIFLSTRCMPRAGTVDGFQDHIGRMPH
jgi:alpha-tubulin suppressor-like RCC1 family protein